MAQSPRPLSSGTKTHSDLPMADRSFITPPPYNDVGASSNVSPIQPVESAVQQTVQKVSDTLANTSEQLALNFPHLLNAEQTEQLFASLKDRFDAHPERHLLINWESVLDRLQKNPDKLWSLQKMEEPDVIYFRNGKYVFIECPKESTRGNIVYDQKAVEELKLKHPDDQCAGNSEDLTAAIGGQNVNKKDYEFLQSLGQFDSKSVCWIHTEPELRATGVALYGYRDEEGFYIVEGRPHSLDPDRSFRTKLEI